MNMIPFNKPFLTGKETVYIQQAVASGKISGDGMFTKKCHQFFEERYGFKKCLLTTSCTDALEMAAILIDIQPGDEVIMPSYTFVSTANAFVLRGAKIVFADSEKDTPNMDVTKLESLITPRTKAIVPVHYAGVGCDMDSLMKLAEKYNLFVVEDAAQAIDSYYKGKPLGGLGHLAAFSFHETKNVIAGEGGMLAINDPRFVERAEIIREKGTNRSAFFRGEVDKYGWVDVGSSFLPSEVIAAFLFAQLEHLTDIQDQRKQLWKKYDDAFRAAGIAASHLPFLPEGCYNNAHMYYLVLDSLDQRTAFIDHCKSADIHPVFHYLSLHKSPFYHEKHDGRVLTNSDFFTDRLVRLPFYYTLSPSDQDFVIARILQFFKKS
jgi:dTDP-4-amino-4,6-dideoxygalactose transaminase